MEETLLEENHVTFKQHERQQSALPRLYSHRVRSHYSSCLTSEGKRLPQLAGQTVKPFPRRKSAPILIRFVARVPRKRAQHDNCFSARSTTKILLLLPARRCADGINLADKIERVIALSHIHTQTHIRESPRDISPTTASLKAGRISQLFECASINLPQTTSKFSHNYVFLIKIFSLNDFSFTDFTYEIVKDTCIKIFLFTPPRHAREREREREIFI